jgi:hypothetical protein
MSCPKCGFPRQPESNECPKCGIIYDKYEEFIGSKQTGDIVKVSIEKKRINKEFVKIFLNKLSIKKRISQLTSFQKSALILLVILINIGIGFMIFKPDITINGEIFIVTKKGENVKLGMLEVYVFPIDTLIPYLLERTKDRNDQLPIIVKKIGAAKIKYDAASQETENAFQWDFANFDKAIAARDESKLKWLKLRTEEEEITSCNFFFRKLPVPLSSTKTDSEGKFNFLIPGSDLHAIAASATRRVLNDIEKYYWITTIDPKKGSRQTAILSNDNLVYTDDIEELISMYTHESP